MTAVFPDVEIALRAVLGGIADVATEVPPDPDGTLAWLPLIRVNVQGGSDDKVTDSSTVNVDVFAATKLAASQLAEQVRQALINGSHPGGEWTLDSVSTRVKPRDIQYVDNPPPWRYAATYAVTARRTTS